MSRHTQEILFGVASQTLTLDCPDGRPTSITDVQCWESIADDTATEENCFTGSAVIEGSPNTTIDSASGASQADPTKISVASTSGATVGRRYLVTSGKDHNEWFECASVTDGDYIVARHPLLNDYEVTASTVESTRISATIDTTWASDTSNLSPTLTPNPHYRVRWTVVIGGLTYVYESSFDLVRYNARHHVTPTDVARRQPNWLDYLPTDERIDQGRSLIERAWQAVKFDLYGDGKADQAVRNPEALDEVVTVKAVQLSVEDRALQNAAGPTELEVADRIYRQRYDQFFRAPVVAMDHTGGGGAAVLTPTPLWRR